MTKRWRNFFDAVLCLLFAAILGSFFALMLLEYAYGCGVYYVDAEGVRRVGECLFLPIGGE